MMKSFSSRLIVLVSLVFFTATAFASDTPTLDDIPNDEVSTTLQPGEPAADPMTQTDPLMEDAADPTMDTYGEPPLVEATPALVNITELVIAQAIADREPVEPGALFTTDTERLYCHTRVASMEPATITHVWYRDGERVAEIPLQVGAGSSWRTWSSKAIFPPTPATWRVEVVAEDGTLLTQTDFTVE